MIRMALYGILFGGFRRIDETPLSIATMRKRLGLYTHCFCPGGHCHKSLTAFDVRGGT